MYWPLAMLPLRRSNGTHWSRKTDSPDHSGTSFVSGTECGNPNSDSIAAIFGHEASLTQCIFNLLCNAIKFVPKGTKPHIQIWTEPMEELCAALG